MLKKLLTSKMLKAYPPLKAFLRSNPSKKFKRSTPSLTIKLPASEASILLKEVLQNTMHERRMERRPEEIGELEGSDQE